MPNALLWGLLAAVLRFIPYLGPFLAALFPIALAVAVDPGWTMLFWVVGLFLVAELISNNVIEPWLYGSSTGLSSLAIIMAAIFWTSLWGPVGLFLATPLTVCLVVIGRYVPQLEFLGVLLGSDPVLAPEERLYQRLLAGNLEEAVEMAEDYVDEHSSREFYDNVAVPALRLAENDRQRSTTDTNYRRLVADTAICVVREVEDHIRDKAASDEPRQRTTIAYRLPSGAAAVRPLSGGTHGARPRRGRDDGAGARGAEHWRSGPAADRRQPRRPGATRPPRCGCGVPVLSSSPAAGLCPLHLPPPAPPGTPYEARRLLLEPGARDGADRRSQEANGSRCGVRLAGGLCRAGGCMDLPPDFAGETPPVLPDTEQAQLAALHDLGLASARSGQFRTRCRGESRRRSMLRSPSFLFVDDVHRPRLRQELTQETKAPQQPHENRSTRT